jgi:hypothetical protein
MRELCLGRYVYKGHTLTCSMSEFRGSRVLVPLPFPPNNVA